MCYKAAMSDLHDVALAAVNGLSVPDIATADGLTEIEVSQSPVEAKG
jgi:hypothetical protein